MVKKKVTLLAAKKRAVKVSPRNAPVFVLNEAKLQKDYSGVLSPMQMIALIGMLSGKTNRAMGKERNVVSHCISEHLREVRRYFKVDSTRMLTILMTELGYVGVVKKDSTAPVVMRTNGYRRSDYDD